MAYQNGPWYSCAAGPYMAVDPTLLIPECHFGFENQSIQFKCVEIHSQISAARLMVASAAQQIDAMVGEGTEGMG